MTRTPDAASPVHVVVAGGGVAALEAVLALRALAEYRVTLELVAPNEDFVERPLAVALPFEAASPERLPLAPREPAIVQGSGQEFLDLVRFHGDSRDPFPQRNIPAPAAHARRNHGPQGLKSAFVSTGKGYHPLQSSSL